MLGDITCDSDGKIDQFIDRRDVKRTLPLHTVNGEPYYLGVFLVGAYQEILGDLHNLFGDTHAVHVSLDERGNVVLDAVIKGDTVKEVLDYVEFDADTLVRKLRHDVELAVREGRISYEESGRLLEFYEEGLQGYTYLEEPRESGRRFRLQIGDLGIDGSLIARSRIGLVARRCQSDSAISSSTAIRQSAIANRQSSTVFIIASRLALNSFPGFHSGIRSALATR